MDRRTDRWKDRQTLFHRTLQATAGGPKRLKNNCLLHTCQLNSQKKHKNVYNNNFRQEHHNSKRTSFKKNFIIKATNRTPNIYSSKNS